jgi:lipopolysaccharide transport system permease protein
MLTVGGHVMDNQSYHSSLLPLPQDYWQHRGLIITLAKREIRARYKGSVFGLLWSFLTPLLLLSVFTFVFGEIFQARWAGSDRVGGLDFAAAMFAGYLIHLFLSDCIGRAPTLILSNVNYVKKVRFPLEILAVVAVISALFHLLTAYLILLILIIFSGWELGWTALWAPVVLVPFVCLVLGLTWMLSALSVFLRDIGQLIVPLLTAMLFLSPVFYPLSSVAERFLLIYQVNPLTLVIEQMRTVLLHQQSPDWSALGIYMIIGVLVLILGHLFFQVTRRGFADVL